MPSQTIVPIIEAIRENRKRFERFCFSLSEEQLNRPVPESDWIVRDFAAHLATLDTELVNWWGNVARGGVVDSSIDSEGNPFHLDSFNDAQVAERRTWPLDRIFAEAEGNRAKLIDQLAQLSDADIDRSMHFAADAKRAASDLPLKQFLVGWAQHDPVHVADMLKALPELAEDPEISAWLDSPFVKGYQFIMNR